MASVPTAPGDSRLAPALAMSRSIERLSGG
jgi:hypothetical protein